MFAIVEVGSMRYPIAEFEVLGPFDVPTKGPSGSKSLDLENISSLWAGMGDRVADSIGCYVYFLRTGGGIKPIYVGKTARQSFRTECATPDKYVKLHVGLDGHQGSLILYLLKWDGRKGKPADHLITELEKILIAVGAEKNPNLLNAQNKSLDRIPGIQGVYRSRRSEQENLRRFRVGMGFE